jgi:hypothetical protein
MRDTTRLALQVALDYYNAWTSKDVDQALSYVAQDIVCESPFGRLENCDDDRGFPCRSSSRASLGRALSPPRAMRRRHC